MIENLAELWTSIPMYWQEFFRGCLGIGLMFLTIWLWTKLAGRIFG